MLTSVASARTQASLAPRMAAQNIAANHALARTRRARREQAGAVIDEAVAPVVPGDVRALLDDGARGVGAVLASSGLRERL